MVNEKEKKKNNYIYMLFFTCLNCTEDCRPYINVRPLCVVQCFLVDIQ